MSRETSRWQISSHRNVLQRRYYPIDCATITEQHLIRQVILSLPKKFRVVIILKYLQDLSYEEIAQIIGCNVGTVKSRLARAKEKLKPRLERAMEVKHGEL